MVCGCVVLNFVLGRQATVLGKEQRRCHRDNVLIRLVTLRNDKTHVHSWHIVIAQQICFKELKHNILFILIRRPFRCKDGSLIFHELF